jgi:hypothetical protein
VDINLNPPGGQSHPGDFRPITETEVDVLEAIFNPPRMIPEGFRSIGDLLRSNITQDWLVPDFLGKSQLASITGAPKTCKTILAQHIALAVARGGLFCGRQCQQGTVLCYFLEGGEAAIKDGFQKKGTHEEDPILINTSGPPPGKDYAESLRETIISMDESPALIIVDTFAKFTGLQNENSYAECVQRLKKLEDITKEFNVTILFIHHAPKNANEGSYGMLGSTALYGSLDNRLWIKKMESLLYLSVTHRNAAELDFTQLDIDHEAGTINLGGTRTEQRQVTLAQEILVLVSESEDAVPLSEIKTRVTGSTQRITDTLAQLVESNELVETRPGGRGAPKHYLIPDSAPVVEQNGIETTRDEFESQST